MDTTTVLEIYEDIQSLSSRQKTVSHLYFKWTIKNFSTLTLGYQKYVTSPTFSSKSVPTTWFMRHSPAFIQSGQVCAQFYLCRPKSDAGSGTASVNYRMGVKMDYEKIWFPERRSISFRPGDESKTEINVCDYFKSDYDLNQDMLIILIEMYISPLQTDSSATKSPNIWRNSQLNLSLDFLNCLSKSTLWDIEIQVKDIRFRVHKSILSARCPFLALLIVDSYPTIHLTEEDYDHIHGLLTYIYTGSPYFTILNGDCCIGFYECAQRYHASGLQQLLTPRKISACTSVTDENAEFTWILGGFSSLIARNESCITSSVFDNQSRIIPQCYLKIYLNCESDTTDSLGIYVKAIEQLNTLHLKITISILGDDMQEKLRKVTESTDILFDEHGFFHYIDKKQLLGNPELLQNDQLIIKCAIELSTLVESLGEAQTFTYPSFDEHFEFLSKDYEKLLHDKKFADLTVVIDDQIFRLHKVILVVRCPVLQSRLSQEDSTDSVIGITDLSPEVFSEMVIYMYTGKFTITTLDSVIKLYEAAKTYRMTSLTVNCSEFLRSHFDIKSICDVIALAHKYEDADLMTNCLKYVSCNESEVLSSMDWKNLIESQSDLSIQLQQWTANLRLLNK